MPVHQQVTLPGQRTGKRNLNLILNLHSYSLLFFRAFEGPVKNQTTVSHFTGVTTECRQSKDMPKLPIIPRIIKQELYLKCFYSKMVWSSLSTDPMPASEVVRWCFVWASVLLRPIKTLTWCSQNIKHQSLSSHSSSQYLTVKKLEVKICLECPSSCMLLFHPPNTLLKQD